MDPFDSFVVDEQLNGRSDPEPLKEVLKQEVDRYNALINTLRTSVVDLDDGIQGLVSITTELENVYDSLLAGRVPDSWSFAYPSLKPLGSWTGNFYERIKQIKNWVFQGMPNVSLDLFLLQFFIICSFC
jgi:dynein heavy chain